MQLDCPRCGRGLEYSDRRPSFCAYCGHALPPSAPETTAPYVSPAHEAVTLPPTDHPAAARAPADPAAPSIPSSTGGYRLVRPLGAGGMGSVYEAEESGSGRRVAVKLIAPEFAGSPETVARFRQEGRLASSIVHPRCVFVHKADE